MTRQQSPSNEASSNKNGAKKVAPGDGAHGSLSVREAGRKGGQRVRELINRGRLAEQREREQHP